jgi:hypothetical protein
VWSAGFAAIIELEQLQAIAIGSASATAGLPAWDEFKADLQEGKMSFPSVRSPFLFAGDKDVRPRWVPRVCAGL